MMDSFATEDPSPQREEGRVRGLHLPDNPPPSNPLSSILSPLGRGGTEVS